MKQFLSDVFESLPTWFRYLVGGAILIAAAYYAVACSTTLTHRVRVRTPQGEYFLVDSLDSSTRQLR